MKWGKTVAGKHVLEDADGQFSASVCQIASRWHFKARLNVFGDEVTGTRATLKAAKEDCEMYLRGGIS